MGKLLRPDRPGLYDGLRGAAPDQLRPRGYIHGGGIYRFFCSLSFARPLCRVFPGLPPALIFGLTVMITMIITSGVGVAIERVAYRPLRRKGASRLYVVITALMCGLILENGNLAILGPAAAVFPNFFQMRFTTSEG